MADKNQYNIRLGKRSKAQLDAISEEWGINQGEAVAYSVDLLCRLFAIDTPDFPPPNADVLLILDAMQRKAE